MDLGNEVYSPNNEAMLSEYVSLSRARAREGLYGQSPTDKLSRAGHQGTCSLARARVGLYGQSPTSGRTALSLSRARARGRRALRSEPDFRRRSLAPDIRAHAICLARARRALRSETHPSKGLRVSYGSA